MRSLRFVLFIVLAPFLAQGATTNVTVGQGGTVFSPKTVTIQTGDTITWTWAGNNHSATSGVPNTPSGVFDSGIKNQGATYSFTFSSAGTYPYYCRVHGAMMTGTITV